MVILRKYRKTELTTKIILQKHLSLEKNSHKELEVSFSSC